MNLTFLSFLILFASLLNFCHCQILISMSGTGFVRGPLENNHLKAIAYGLVTMQEVAADESITPLNVIISYYSNKKKVAGKNQIIDTGKEFTIARFEGVDAVIVEFHPLDSANYIAVPSVLNIDYVSFPIESVIPPNQQAAVAQNLSITGKIIGTTHNIV